MKVTMIDVLNKLGIPIPHTGGKSFRIKSPTQSGNENKAISIMIDGDKQGFQDFATGNSGGAVKFYGIMTGKVSDTHPGDVDKDLYWEIVNEILGDRSESEILTERDKVFSELTGNGSEDEPVIPVAPIEVKHDIYSLLLENCPINHEASEELKARGLTDEDIKRYGYGSPPLTIKGLMSKLQKVYPTFEGIPGFFNRKGWKIDGLLSPCYLIPVKDIDGRIQRIKIRSLEPGKGKYRWLSSNKTMACDDTSYCHFTGYLEETVIITEGPTKANVINKFLGKPVLAVPGVNSQKELAAKMEILAERGVKRVVMAFDMDKITNHNVQKGINDAIKICEGFGVEAKMLEWDPKFKGLDDYLLHIYNTDRKFYNGFKDFVTSLWAY